MHIAEPELAEALEEPGRAGALAEGGRRDGEHLQQPLPQLRLVQVQPMEGAVDRGQGGEPADALVGFGVRGVVRLDHLLRLVYHESRFRGSAADTRRRPGTARVPAPWDRRPRGCARPGCSGMASAGRRRAPMSTKVPTRFRTMWCRNPLPVTR